jgi:septum formation protein
MDISYPKIFLASGSPRRSALLKACDIPFEVLKIKVKETYPEDLHVYDIAPFLAEKKADAATPLVANGDIVITADSVVIRDNVVYGKPEGREDAIHTLRALSGGWHDVVSGVCIVRGKDKRTFSCRTEVKFSTLTDEEIAYYVDRYRPFDKAGSYAIQEWLGHCAIEDLRGSYNNVMGLPTHLVYAALREWSRR